MRKFSLGDWQFVVKTFGHMRLGNSQPARELFQVSVNKKGKARGHSFSTFFFFFFWFLKSEIFQKHWNQFRYFYLLEIGSNCSCSLLDVQMTQICWQKKISQYPKITVLIFAHEIPCLCSCSSNFKVNTQACSAFVIVTAAEVSVVAKNELQPHHFLLAHWPLACQGETVPRGLLGK